jgi:hypothetical protein
MIDNTNFYQPRFDLVPVNPNNSNSQEVDSQEVDSQETQPDMDLFMDLIYGPPPAGKDNKENIEKKVDKTATFRLSSDSRKEYKQKKSYKPSSKKSKSIAKDCTYAVKDFSPILIDIKDFTSTLLYDSSKQEISSPHQIFHIKRETIDEKSKSPAKIDSSTLNDDTAEMEISHSPLLPSASKKRSADEYETSHKKIEKPPRKKRRTRSPEENARMDSLIKELQSNTLLDDLMQKKITTEPSEDEQMGEISSVYNSAIPSTTHTSSSSTTANGFNLRKLKKLTFPQYHDMEFISSDQNTEQIIKDVEFINSDQNTEQLIKIAERNGIGRSNIHEYLDAVDIDGESEAEQLETAIHDLAETHDDINMEDLETQIDNQQSKYTLSREAYPKRYTNHH